MKKLQQQLKQQDLRDGGKHGRNKRYKKSKDTWLSGMDEICGFVNRSAPTLLKWKKERGFPMKKINGVWESDTELILDWRKGQFFRE